MPKMVHRPEKNKTKHSSYANATEDKKRKMKMKKLLVVLAAIALAVGANANTLLWGINSTGGSLDTTKFADATVYLMYSSTAVTIPTTSKTSGFSTSDLTAGAQLLTGDMTAGAFDGSQFIDSLSGKTWFYLAAISDDGKYMAISTTTKTATMGTGTGNTALRWMPTQFTVYGSSDIPEPTSGLLLLVGGAMLALRRKRA